MILTRRPAQKFFAHVKEQAAGLMSDEHFTVDGTLIEAWAGQKSFRRKDNGGSGSGGDFHGESRRNQTHASRTDPEARLYKKSAGQESKLSYLGHTLVENRNGLIAAAMTTQADGRAERDAALLMLYELTGKRSGRITTGADKAYDTRDFVDTVRELGVTPHVARRQHGAIDERTSRHPGYAISLSKRWLVEKPFGWLKQIGPLKKVKLRGLAKVDWLFTTTAAKPEVKMVRYSFPVGHFHSLLHAVLIPLHGRAHTLGAATIVEAVASQIDCPQGGGLAKLRR